MEKKAYLIVVEERYTRTGVVYAESSADAIAFMEDLYESGELDMDRNCYEGRNVKCFGEVDAATADRFDTYYNVE